MAELKSVKIMNAALDESPLRGGTITLRGVIAPETLKNLKTDEYQREALPISSTKGLLLAVKNEEIFPDIEIGMRGSRTRDSDGEWFLFDDCYIIDGLQRVTACLRALDLDPNQKVRLGATIHFNATREWEVERFRVLNSERLKLSPNVLLRNLAPSHPALNMLYKMTDEANSGFCLAGRVAWNQHMRRGDLLTGFNYLRPISRLHAHVASGGTQSVVSTAQHFDKIAEQTGMNIFRDNVVTFYSAIDEIWGIRTVHYRDLTPHLKGTFLAILARILTNHTDFWKNAAQSRLFLDADTRRKLKLLKLQDPNIRALASAVGPTQMQLYDLIVRHLNSGKRAENRLHVRATADVSDPSVLADEEAA